MTDSRLIITDCTLIDGTSETARPKQEVHIDRDAIAWVGDAAVAPPFSDAIRVDVGGSYVLPGLGDAHAHLCLLDRPLPRPANVPGHMACCTQSAIDALRGGFTMLRLLAEGYGVDVALRDLFNNGTVLGPRLWVAGEALTPSAGHMAEREDGWGVRVCDGADGWRKAARDQLQMGADMVKALVTGGAIGPEHDMTNAVTVLEEELVAAAEVVQSRGKRLVVHAASPAGARLAAKVGATSVEHGYNLDEASARLLADQGIWLTPTLTVTHQIPSQLLDDYERAAVGNLGLPDAYMRRREERIAGHQASFKLALDAGVKMLTGPDSPRLPGSSHCELAFMVRNGMTPWQVIVAATRSFAEAVGASDRVGTIETGKWADLIAVRDNPLDDIRNLRHPSLVLRGGAFAVNAFANLPIGVA